MLHDPQTFAESAKQLIAETQWLVAANQRIADADVAFKAAGSPFSGPIHRKRSRAYDEYAEAYLAWLLAVADMDDELAEVLEESIDYAKEGAGWTLDEDGVLISPDEAYERQWPDTTEADLRFAQGGR